MDADQKIDKLKVNTIREQMFSHAEVWDLVENSPNWRVIWEEIPTDMLFDQLYGTSGRYEAFIYRGVLYERRASEPDTYSWQNHGDEDDSDDDAILEWLLDNPPFECCVPVADLRRHAKGFISNENPWALFLKLTGYDNNDVNMSMLPIGGNDATYIGRAITAWGEYADVIDTYISLLINYEGT